jgi:VWFA-related protein
MRLEKLIPVIALTIALLSALAVTPQERPPTPARQEKQETVTIRAQASEVLVDAIVTDKRNRLVTDLKPEDFVIYEDGKEQKILSMRLAREAVPTAQPAPRPSEPPAPAAPQSVPEKSPLEMPNLTILLLDYSTTQFENQRLVQTASAKYVEERLRPNDLMAVFVLGTSLRFVTDFTNDKETLLAALRSREAMGSALAAERASNAGEIARARITSTMGPRDISTISISGPGAAAAGASLAATGAARAAAMLAARIEAQYVALQSALNKRTTRGVLTAIRAIALGVSQIEGRKNLILFSQGFVVGEALEDELHSVVDLANRSRLAIYSIDSRGLETKELTGELAGRSELNAINEQSQRDRMAAVGGESVFDRALQAGSDQEESALRYISYETGGFLIRNTNDLNVGLRRVDEEMRGYYLLSYRPTNPVFDGKFRQIRVEVRQQGLTVRARTGYYAIPRGFELLSPEEYQVVQAARSAGRSAALYVRAGGFREEGNLYRVPVVLEMPTRSIRFEQSGKFSVARLQIIGLVRDIERNPVARFGRQVQYSASEADYKILEPGNVSLLDSVELAPGNYTYEVTVKDLASGNAAYREQGLYLRDQQPELTMSTILLARNVDKAAGTTSQFLTVGGARILPSAQCEFRNGDNLIFYFDVYYPKVEAERKTDVAVSTWLMLNGQRLQLGLSDFRLAQVESSPFPHMTVARYVKLAGLDAGDYSLVVRVRDALADRTTLAQAPFTIVK